MVYKHVLVIRGIILSQQEKNALESGEIEYGDEVEDLCDKYIDDDGLIGQFSIYEWPCCSPLQHEQFILGKLVGKYNIIEMFKGIVTSDSIDFKYEFDPELEVVSKGYGFPSTPQTYLILDDCMFCS